MGSAIDVTDFRMGAAHLLPQTAQFESLNRVLLENAAEALAGASPLKSVAEFPQHLRSPASVQAAQPRPRLLERHLKAAESGQGTELSGVLETIGDAFFSVDRDWRLTYVNRHCSDFVNVPSSQAIGQLLWEVEPTLIGTVFMERFRAAMSSGELAQFEDYYEARALWIAARVYPHEAGLSVFFHDVSDRRQAQLALEESEKRFRDVLETTPAGYILADEELTILDVNPAICKILDLEEPAIIGTPLRSMVDPSSWPEFIRNLYETGSTHSFECKLAYSAGGEEIYALINANFEAKPDGGRGRLTAFVTDISAHKKAESRLAVLASRDPLTNLPNRWFLNKRLKEMLSESLAEEDTALAVMFIDLDRFKEVNDSLGHEAGDLLLKEVAVRLRACLRAEDLVARLGGDEFVVVVRSPDCHRVATVVAEKIVNSLVAPMTIEGHEVIIGASIGISVQGTDGDTPEILFQNADTAMYKAKAAGRNGYRFFSAEMNQEARTRFTMETALRHAIERRELSLHYQPRIELKSMQVVGMEALIRWNHPQLGSVPPLEFISLAEESGLINTIGEWVLLEACKQNKLWVNNFATPLRVSVNLSARQLKSTSLVNYIESTLQATGLPANLLELEITETALMEDPSKAAQVLERLKGLGISLSIDDFGTGHSSLAYLRQFPIDSVKLDRAFLTEIRGNVSPKRLTEAIINLVHTLNMCVVAEGVESREILQFLRTAKCDQVQGYYLARPMPAEEFEAYIRQRAWTQA